jgi:methylmalonyl-CoA mutase N-terminal domain/subunit
VGVNAFTIEHRHVETRAKRFQNDNQRILQRQVKRLNKVKSRRNEQEVKKALVFLKDCASKQDNLMPPILDAVRKLATLGEIIDVLKCVYGEYEDQVNI